MGERGTGGPSYRVGHLEGRVHQAQVVLVVAGLQADYVVDNVVHLEHPTQEHVSFNVMNEQYISSPLNGYLGK